MILVGLLVLCGLGISAPASSADADIEIYVYAETPCLAVSHTRISFPDLARSVVTDSSGYARLRGLPPGEHRMRLQASGGMRLEATLTIRRGVGSVVVTADLASSRLDVVTRPGASSGARFE